MEHEIQSSLVFPDSLATPMQALKPDENWLLASPLGYQVQTYGMHFHPLSHDESYVRAFENLWPSHKATFGALYLNGADQESHLYWPFVDPITQESIRRNPEERKSRPAWKHAGRPMG